MTTRTHDQKLLLAHQLRFRRERVGLSRRDIANRLHVNYGTFTRWELQFHVPADDILTAWDEIVYVEEIRTLRFLARLYPTEIPDVSNDVAVLP